MHHCQELKMNALPSLPNENIVKVMNIVSKNVVNVRCEKKRSEACVLLVPNHIITYLFHLFILDIVNKRHSNRKTALNISLEIEKLLEIFIRCLCSGAIYPYQLVKK